MTTESDLIPPNDVPTLRVNGPADLVEAVPFLLGFHPAESLVLIGLSDARVVVTARIDLDELTLSGHLVDTVGAICRGGAREVVGIVFDDRVVPAEPMPWSGLALEITEEVQRIGARASDVLLVSGQLWWSYACADSGCCPADGGQLGAGPSAISAAMTFAGLVALPDRATVAALLEPLTDERRARLGPRLDEAESAAVQRVFAGQGDREQRSVKRALFAAARAADTRGRAPTPTDAEVVRYAVALRTYPVRDAVWIAVDDSRLDGRELWRELARRVPGQYAAAPLFLFGWASWRAGNGSLAGMAAERALVSDPGYTAADLLLAALSHGVDPRSMPRLRGSRSA